MARKPNPSDSKAPRSIQNRRARFDYAIEDTYEAGVALQGSEVKSVFGGRAHLTDSYCLMRDGELWLINMDIEPYEQASVFGHERRRDRKLLLHKRELTTIDRRVREKGLTMVPMAAYFKNGKVKVEVALARGKAQYDKRQTIAERDTRREVEQARSIR